MGKGIYLYEGASLEVAHLKAADLPESVLMDELLVSGARTQGVQAIGDREVRTAWQRLGANYYLLIGRFGVHVRPLTADVYDRQRRRRFSRRRVDDRGLVQSPADWFSGPEDDMTVDVYNTEVLAVRRWEENSVPEHA